METIYFDSSALVKAYVREAGSTRVLELLYPIHDRDLIIAEITTVEVVAALARRSRDVSQRPLNLFKQDIDDGLFTTVMMSSEIVRSRESRSQPAIRLVSADVELNEAAAQEGLVIENPNESA